MLTAQKVMIYLKTTETCQLDCSHCFTSGSNGRKIYFDVDKTIDWYQRLKRDFPFIDGGHTAFHGGEPFLAPLEDMWRVYNGCKDIFEDMWWSVTTNLVFPLTAGKLELIDVAFNNNISTSWDKGIRFATQEQEDLWEKNVRTLTAIPGFQMTCQVSISRSITDMDPKDLLDKMIDLGVDHLHLERITLDGNAKKNLEVLPHNSEQDEWFVRFWEAYIQDEKYNLINVTFFESILTSLLYDTHSGCRCRECERKIFTLNADGTIGGCPNSAVSNPYGNIDMEIVDLMTCEGRLKNIVCETNRDPRCLECPVQDICNGDCHQLAWDGDVCPAPKSLMIKFKEDNDLELYKRVIGNFKGQE